MNNVTFVGRISNDISTFYSKDEDPVARSIFNFAVPDMSMKKDKDGNYPCDYFRIATFGKTAENIEKYCSKGTKLLITGRVKNNNYETDGVMVYGTEIIADYVEFLETKKTSSKK